MGVLSPADRSSCGMSGLFLCSCLMYFHAARPGLEHTFGICEIRGMALLV